MPQASGGTSPHAGGLARLLLQDRDEWERRCATLREAGFEEVPSFNPYWDISGRTFQDPDGYRIVLQRESWPSLASPKGQG